MCQIAQPPLNHEYSLLAQKDCVEMFFRKRGLSSGASGQCSTLSPCCLPLPCPASWKPCAGWVVRVPVQDADDTEEEPAVEMNGSGKLDFTLDPTMVLLLFQIPMRMSPSSTEAKPPRSSTLPWTPHGTKQLYLMKLKSTGNPRQFYRIHPKLS